MSTTEYATFLTTLDDRNLMSQMGVVDADLTIAFRRGDQVGIDQMAERIEALEAEIERRAGS